VLVIDELELAPQVLKPLPYTLDLSWTLRILELVLSKEGVIAQSGIRFLKDGHTPITIVAAAYPGALTIRNTFTKETSAPEYDFQQYQEKPWNGVYSPIN
jgi:hypothetical protein